MVRMERELFCLGCEAGAEGMENWESERTSWSGKGSV